MKLVSSNLRHGWMAMAACALIGCAEKSVEQKPKTSTSSCEKSTDPSCSANTSSSDDKLCVDLKADSAANGAHGGFIGDLCNQIKSAGVLTTALAKLRETDRVYKGGDTPVVTEESKELADKKSQMVLYTSNIYDTDAKSYFQMMKLQMLKPDEFKTAGFSYDENIKYTIKTQSASNVSYNYLNDAETTVVVNYDATTTFYELKSSTSGVNRYFIGTKLTEGKETVKELEGAIVINEYLAKGKDGADKLIAEVFTISRQVYDNNNDHATTLKKAKDNIGKEQIRSFKNATKSRAYFSK